MISQYASPVFSLFLTLFVIIMIINILLLTLTSLVPLSTQISHDLTGGQMAVEILQHNDKDNTALISVSTKCLKWRPKPVKKAGIYVTP